jgi:hypothetical protein
MKYGWPLLIGCEIWMALIDFFDLLAMKYGWPLLIVIESSKSGDAAEFGATSSRLRLSRLFRDQPLVPLGLAPLAERGA